MQLVFRELSSRDKGAARVVRERLDEIKRAKGQEAIAAEWSAKAEGLLAQPKLNIADAMAWQRDAAKAGAPLSREPLAGLKAQLAERIRGIEDLQHRVQVQREAAVLLAQRIEVLSTKPWRDAQAAAEALRVDVPDWQSQADALVQDPGWVSVDARFPPLLDASRSQLQLVWEAFQTALSQTAAADADPAAPLPPVPVWADEVRAARGLPPEAPPAKPGKPKVDPQARAHANEAVSAALARLQKEVTEGHGKASTDAAAALRTALKEHGRLVDDKLESEAHAALAAAGEMEGWQRWRTDQLRQELVAKAENLFESVPVRGAPASRAGEATQAPSKDETPASSEVPTAVAGEMPGPDEAARTEEVAAPAPEQQPIAQAAPEQEPVAEAASPEAEAASAPEAEAASAPEAETAGEADTDAAAQAATPASEAAAAPASGAGSEAAPARKARGGRAAPAAVERKPRYGGRRMQEELRSLRDQWKKLDQGGAPNHALWKRFDHACNEAYKVVEAWLEKVKTESAEHRARRLALIEELRAWAAGNEGGAQADWKAFARALHQFESRWREAGHLSEKAFAELQPQWKEALAAAEAPLAGVQKQSLERRHAMIEEAKALGAQPALRIDAVRSLQQRWQAEAQAVPLERKQEQKLWEAFRKPIDDAFNRKSEERERAAASLSERDRAVLECSKALEAANASGDAQKIRTAMAALDAALKGQAAERAQAAAAAPASAPEGAPAADAATDSDAAPAEGTEGTEGDTAAAPPPPKPAPKPVVARRGDDRPGMKRDEPAQPGRGGRFGDRKPGGPGAGRPGERGAGFGRDGGRDAGRGGRFGDRAAEDRGPRLGDVAFRAQRDALDHAQQALRKLAAQAHGEALGQLLGAWEQRAPDQVPSQSELGRAVSPAVRGSWVQALQSGPSGDASEALLRLEIAAEVPTPAEHLDARRAFQLQLLTRRNDPSPAQTWGQDAARVFASAHQPNVARRLQNVLKVLLRG
ncbi:DUF349 domain-containing protein [Ramlibacter rhizophilus]|uniref:DUF349 domain-containing protein n=2 Tax=Ramlibacter rhizophilus TaxID=1781167 RepID=A0A4Z0C2B0_9BURK|nr:DUF349 domain-containing protein [Ramlibacter rhizophilus]